MKNLYICLLSLFTCTLLPNSITDLEKQIAHRLICKDTILAHMGHSIEKPIFDKNIIDCCAKDEKTALLKQMQTLLQHANKQELLSMLATYDKEALSFKQLLLTQHKTWNKCVNISSIITAVLFCIGCGVTAYHTIKTHNMINKALEASALKPQTLDTRELNQAVWGAAQPL